MGHNRLAGRRRRVLFGLVLAAQVFLAVLGVADQWTRGHNGWNGAAYQNAARNTLRWHVLFPLQYDTANVPPKKERLYTHAPLSLHLHTVASVWLFGDRETSVRAVAGFWNVAALCMLFAVVRRLWGDAHALTASAIYVALPINAIYTNMANHSAGFIFWGLLAVFLYLRADRATSWSQQSFVAFLAAFAMAATWDWPAYYLAGCIAIHWLWTLVGSRGSAPAARSARKLWVFCAWVVVLFVGHLVLVEVTTGNLDELTGTFNARRALSWPRFRTHLAKVPELMFTVPILALTLGWLAVWVVRVLRGTARSRDLVPVAFLVGGLLHYWTFRWSAVVHSYWAWPMLPAVAIAVSTALFAIARWARARWGLAAASVAVLLLVTPLAVRDLQIVPKGRYVGGSMWFFTPIRGPIDEYDSGRPELRFARRVKAWTDRETGAQLHTSLQPLRLEPRFDITLDRVTHRWVNGPRQDLPPAQGATGWVFIAAVDAFTETERAAFAAKHPYKQYGDYFMVDLRERAREIRVWGLTPVAYRPRWWLLHSPFEPAMRASRRIAAEQALNQEVAELDAQ